MFFFTAIERAQLNPGARQIALSNCDAAFKGDVFSIFNNPACASDVVSRQIGIFISPAPFGQKELANSYLAYLEPLGNFTFLTGAMKYGFDLYSEKSFSLGTSYAIREKFYFSIMLSYFSVSIRHYGSDDALLVNLGALGFISKGLRWGFSFRNLTRASVGSCKDQIPVIFENGLCCEITEELTLGAAIEKEINYPFAFKYGLEYSIAEFLVLRFGSAFEPTKFSAGLGINYSVIRLDYAVFTHSDLGLTHQAGILIGGD